MKTSGSLKLIDFPVNRNNFPCFCLQRYGVETWTASKTSEKRLNAFEMWSLRRMMRVSWTRRLSNENIIKLAGVTRELFRVVQNRKVCYFGHMMQHKIIQRKLIEGMVPGNRGQRKTKKSVVSQLDGLDGHELCSV